LTDQKLDKISFGDKEAGGSFEQKRDAYYFFPKKTQMKKCASLAYLI